jgi:hypothetical protein
MGRGTYLIDENSSMQNGADASSCRRNDQLSGAAQARSPPSDFDALVAVLDEGVVVQVDAVVPGAPSEVRGARTWARQAIAFTRGAQFVRPALVNGAVGVVLAPRGRLLRALSFKDRCHRRPRASSTARSGGPQRLNQAVGGRGRIRSPGGSPKTLEMLPSVFRHAEHVLPWLSGRLFGPERQRALWYRSCPNGSGSQGRAVIVVEEAP